MTLPKHESAQDDPRFTTNWTRGRTELWDEHLAKFQGQPVQALEIGTYQGRSACWFLEHVLTHPDAHLTCVDPYRYFDRKEIVSQALQRAKRMAEKNLSPFGGKVTRKVNFSFNVLPRLPGDSFSFAYVDGQHTAGGCLYDMVACWPLLKAGGILIVDDVNPGPGPKKRWRNNCPNNAAKRFMDLDIEYRELWFDRTIGLEKL